jgi:hypothetical protein
MHSRESSHGSKGDIMELMKAHQQWKTRPSDERFKSVQDMHTAVLGFKDASGTAIVPTSSLRVEAVDNDLKLVGKMGVPATLTHWSMGQVCHHAGAPAAYIRGLPATLAAQNINHGLKAHTSLKDTSALLFHQDDGLTLRGAVSEVYKRIWNSDITQRLLKLQETNPNWKNPLGYANGQMGGELVPSGLYASDHDMFAFLVDESKTLDGSPKGLNRGFFTWNSEVGGSSFGFMGFYYDRVCGNNIVWGAKDVFSTKIRHVGKADDKAFQQLAVQMVKYQESEGGQVETMIQKAKAFELGNTTEEILDKVFGMAQKQKSTELNKTRLTAAIETAQKREDRYGNSNTLWSIVSGLTENSQDIPFMDERLKIDKAAGKLLNVIEF